MSKPIPKPRDPLIDQLVADALRVLEKESPLPQPFMPGVPSATGNLEVAKNTAENVLNARFSKLRPRNSRGVQLRAEHLFHQRSYQLTGTVDIQVPFTLQLTDEMLARMSTQEIQTAMHHEAQRLADHIVDEIRRKIGIPTDGAPTRTPTVILKPADEVDIPAMPFEKEA